MQDERFEGISDEVKAKAIACKTPEEILELAESEGMSLTMDDLEEVSGGHAWGDCGKNELGHCTRD
jgi:hypothetical protein